MLRHLKCYCHKELWDAIISFPFINDGAVQPMYTQGDKNASIESFRLDQLLS